MEMTFELDIIELYKMLTENPEEFGGTLGNIYAYETLRLLSAIDGTIQFIGDENGIEPGRDRYVEEEIEGLANEISKTILLASFFRCVNLSEDRCSYTSNNFMNDLGRIKRLVEKEKDYFSEHILNVRKDSHERHLEKDSKYLGVFTSWKTTRLETFAKIREKLVDLDNKFCK